MMQIVYTQKHNIYYLNRVRMDDDRLIDKGNAQGDYRGV